MEYDDRIQRIIRRPKSDNFSEAKDRYRSRTRGGYPFKPFRGTSQGMGGGNKKLEGRGLGSFENQMMMDRLMGPAGMNFNPQTTGQQRAVSELLEEYLNRQELQGDNLLPGNLFETQNPYQGDLQNRPQQYNTPPIGSPVAGFTGAPPYGAFPPFGAAGFGGTEGMGGSFTDTPIIDGEYYFSGPTDYDPRLGYIYGSRGGIMSLKR